MDRDGAVVYTHPAIEIRNLNNHSCGVSLTNKAVSDLGFGDIFLARDSRPGADNRLLFPKGVSTTHLSLPMELEEMDEGSEIKLELDGAKPETKLKIVAFKELRSAGVAGKPVTVGAALRFILHAHAAEKVGAAGDAGE